MGVSAYGRIGVSACRWTFGDEKRPIAGLEDLAPPGFIQAFNGSVWLGRISEAIENVGVTSRAGQLGVLTLQILALRPPTPAHTPIRPYAHRRYADTFPRHADTLLPYASDLLNKNARSSAACLLFNCLAVSRACRYIDSSCQGSGAIAIASR